VPNPKLEIRLDGAGYGKVILDGKDISNSVRGLSVNTNAGCGTEANLKVGMVPMSVVLDEELHGRRRARVSITLFDTTGWQLQYEFVSKVIEFLRENCCCQVEIEPFEQQDKP
jgi:hypothetical protein